MEFFSLSKINIGDTVRKKSNKPFKSSYKLANVSSIVEMNDLSMIKDKIVYGCTFVEDSSTVEIEKLTVIKETK
jgi:hypothetical protein